LCAIDTAVNGAIQVVLAAPPDGVGLPPFLRALSSRFVPSLVLAAGGAAGDHSEAAISKGKLPVGGVATAYVCRHYTCDAPTQQPADFEKQLDRVILPSG